jgi:hypothetical protein
VLVPAYPLHHDPADQPPDDQPTVALFLGAPIQRIEVQINNGGWREAQLDATNCGRFAWKFWTLEWADQRVRVLRRHIMRKGVWLAFTVGFAMILMTGLGLTLGASAVSAGSRPRKASAPDSFRVRPATEVGQEIQVINLLRISIPFGFQTPLMLRDVGQRVRVAGHGACTAGEPATIQVTVTQTSTAAVATGQTQEECTGDRQTWGVDASIAAGATFVADPAQACGAVVTMKRNLYGSI